MFPLPYWLRHLKILKINTYSFKYVVHCITCVRTKVYDILLFAPLPELM